MSSCVFIARKNQSPAVGPPETLEFTGADITVAQLRSTLAQLRRLDPSEVELSLAGSILTDQHPPVPRQSTVEVRRKPPTVRTHTQRGLAAQTEAWAKGGAGRPVAPAVPLSQQRKPSFGLGTFQEPGGATYAYADREAQSGCEPSVPRLPAPPQPQPHFPIRTQQHVQYDSNNLPPPPKEFACSLCSGWIADAYILRCCGVSVCKACVDDARFRNCRDCRAALPGGGSAACLSNRNLQAIILQTQRHLVASATAAHEPTDASPTNDTPSSPNVHAPMSVDPDDLYTLLGVPSHSTQPEIAKAYRALALQLHPDKQSASVDPQKTARFVKVTAAYELLSDTEARRRYDHNQMVHSMRAKRQRR